MRINKIVERRKFRKKILKWLVISSNIRVQNYLKLRNKTIIKHLKKLRKIFLIKRPKIKKALFYQRRTSTTTLQLPDHSYKQSNKKNLPTIKIPLSIRQKKGV